MATAQSEMKIHFDPQNDVLYCSFGEPQEAISMETDSGVIVRVNPETDQVVGFTIVDFLRRSAARSDTLSVPLSMTAGSALC